MPDQNAQLIYDELNKRGAFKSDPQAAAIGHELRRRGVVKDVTQGGSVQGRSVQGGRAVVDFGGSSHDPYGDPADQKPSARPAPKAVTEARSSKENASTEAHTPANFFKDLIGANGKRGEIKQGLIDLIGANPKQKHGLLHDAAVGGYKAAKTMILPLIPGNDNPLDLSAGQDALQNAGAGMVDNDPFLANAARAAGGQKTQLGKDIFDHKLQTLADFLPGLGAASGALRGAGTLAKIAGAERLAGGLGKAAEVAHDAATLGPVGKAVRRGAKAAGGKVASLSEYAPKVSLPKVSLPKVSLPKLKGKPLPTAPPEVVPAPSAAPLGPHPLMNEASPIAAAMPRPQAPPAAGNPIEALQPEMPATLAETPAAPPAEAPAAPGPRLVPKGLQPDFPVDQLQTDPERFQYKLGAGQGGQTGSLSGAPAFNQDLAGVVHAWTDPTDGLHYVVNGHNRHALAVRSGQAGLDTRFLDAPTAEEARTQGALINIAEGQGTAIDAAKLFRDQKITPEELAAQGIAVKGEKARQGMALANLAPPLFGQVVRGELPVERAALIGEKLPEAVETRWR